YINSMNVSKKSKSVKTPVKRKVWKSTGKLFKTIGYIWKPTGRTFTLVGNVCPLTRIATATIVPPREPIPIVKSTDKLVVTLVVQIVLWYLDSGCSKHMTKDRSQLINFVQKFLGTVKFGNDHVAKIMGYGDYQIGNVIISRVYYVEGLGSNLFSVGQFYDSDLEVAFCQHTCFIRNLDGVDLLTGSRGNNLYTLSLQDMLASSPVCILSKASKTKSWLWHRRLSHLNFGAINHLARQGLVRGLPKLKFEKDHLCSACAMGKSTKKTHKPKFEDTNQEKLYLLHMDLYGLMSVESVNGKKIIMKRLASLMKHQLHALHSRMGSLKDVTPDLSFFHVFGALCYPTNDSENVASYVPPSRNDWDFLFQPMFDELLNPPPSVVNQAAEVIAPITEVIPQVDADSTGSPSSTTVDQDAPSPSKSLTPTEIQSSVILQDDGNDNMDIEVAHIGNDMLLGVPIPEVTSEQSSSTASPQSNVQSNHS
nr:retrovirus-related Pol polyprotein from transposon TNT 1-94 [Tanacetum cinerariifolium]